MKFQDSIKTIIDQHPEERTLWDGKYKIPWDDPGFSRRMLQEHLSQDHGLASRKKEIIKKQVQWIHEHHGKTSSGKLLDIGCGPGLYIEQFAKLGYECTGIDFSPASIRHAEEIIGRRARLIEGDIRTADFDNGYDLAVMLYGELNVFSPDECRNILKKAYNALSSGGIILLEVHTYEAIKRIADVPYTWYKSGPGLQGLFSDQPHLCLIENHWFDNKQTALQIFHILDDNGDLATYRSTNKAWTDDQYKQLLSEAGFSKLIIHSDWPTPSDAFKLISAEK